MAIGTRIRIESITGRRSLEELRFLTRANNKGGEFLVYTDVKMVDVNPPSVFVV